MNRNVQKNVQTRGFTTKHSIALTTQVALDLQIMQGPRTPFVLKQVLMFTTSVTYEVLLMRRGNKKRLPCEKANRSSAYVSSLSFWLTSLESVFLCLRRAHLPTSSTALLTNAAPDKK